MIAVVGGYGVGITMRVERAPEAGETISGGVLTRGPGGKGSNQAIGISRLGHECSLFTAVGSDSAGDEARALWAQESVDFSSVITRGPATMTGFITVDATGENRISIAPGALAALNPADVEGFRAHIRTADLLVVSLEVPWAVAHRALELAREVGTPTLLNPAPAHPLQPSDWQLIDVITPNSSEAALLLGDDFSHEPEANAAELARRGDCRVVLTLGSRGAVVADGRSVTRIDPARASAVVDTTGAGDAFTAALAVALVEGHSLADAARWAGTAGAHAVGIGEVVPALPRRRDLSTLTNSYDKEPV